MIIKVEKSSFKLKEVEKFIKSCAKIGAVDIVVGEISVKFGEKSKSPRAPRKAVLIAQEKEEQTAELQEQLNLMSEELSISHLEDPAGFEDAIAAGKLGEEIQHI
jgi:hypothetical protein